MEGEKGSVTINNNAVANNKNNAEKIDPRACLEKYYIETTNIPREYLTAIYYEILAYTLGDLYEVVIPTKITGDKPIRTNLWMVFAGPSGERKSDAVEIISETLRSIEIMSSLVERILQKLINSGEPENDEPILTREETRETIEEAEERFTAMKRTLGSREGFARHISENYTKTNGKFLVELDEARSLLQSKKGYVEELMDLLLTIYMGKSYSLTYSNGREYIIRKPNYICLIGGAQLLKENYDLYLFERGFYRRAIIVYGEKRNDGILPPPSDLGRVKDLLAFVIAIAIKRVFVRYLWKKIQERHRPLRKYNTIPVNLAPMFKYIYKAFKEHDKDTEHEPLIKIIKYIEKLVNEEARAEDPKIKNLLNANSVHVMRLWILNTIADAYPDLSWIIDKARSVIDEYVDKKMKEFDEIYGGKRFEQDAKGIEDPEEYAKSNMKNMLNGKLDKDEVVLLQKIVMKIKERIDYFLKKDNVYLTNTQAVIRGDFEDKSLIERAIEDMENIYRGEKMVLEKVIASIDEEELIVKKVAERIMEIIRKNGAQGIPLSEIYRHLGGKKRRYVKEALRRLVDEDRVVFTISRGGRGKPTTMIFPADAKDRLSGAILPESTIANILN